MDYRAKILDALIEAKGYSRRSFAEKVGVPPTTLQSILTRGVGRASVENVIKICKSLGITVEEMENMANSEQTEDVKPIFRLLRLYSMRYKGQLTDEQLIDSGIKGLIKAFEQFDSSRSYKFMTLADRYIENEILMTIRKVKGNTIDTIETIYATRKGEEWTEKELEEIEQFKEFVRTKRHEQPTKGE